jgi:hypothetical protein
VIGGCRRYARTLFVTAVAAFAIAVASNTNAQDAPDVAWWHELQLPDGPTQASLLETVQATPVSVLDPTLPAISLERWLWLTLSPVVQVLYPRLADWRVTYCLDPHSEIPDVGSQLCAEATVRLSAERNFRLVIAIAEGVRNAPGRPQFLPTSPSLRDVYIERLDGSRRIDSLDLPALGSLPQRLNVPFEKWPTVNFESTITWDPPNPAPGDTVRFSISIRNTGPRSADRALVNIMIGRCCDNVTLRHEYAPHFGADQSVRLEGTVLLPEGRAMATVSVKPLQRDKVVRESDPDKRPTLALVGYPPGLR